MHAKLEVVPGAFIAVFPQMAVRDRTFGFVASS
jgi:hypothetical protein